MKLCTRAMLAILTCMFISPQLFAGNVEVVWTNPGSYRDIQAGQEHRRLFEQRTFESLEKHFTRLARELPENQVLKINVTDVDLAGRVQQAGMNQIRVLNKSLYPRIELSYQLIRHDASVIVAEKASITDRSFMQRRGSRYQLESLEHEKKMLDDWFQITFSHLITQNI